MSRGDETPPPPGRARRVLRFIGRWLLRLLWLSVAVGLALGAWAAISYQRYVVDDPGEHLSRSYIDAVIAQESPVLYRDGRTPVGVFFAQEHRQYVRYAQLPQAWVDAIVSAEDKRFFEHPGIDPEGLARAMVQNVRARKVVAGGSTLTQQTAKNLYYRPDRSMRSKWEELVNALRLEHVYSKEQILEFYANQFHVSSNGRGLGIAARYFFDKPADKLDLLESAFVAGMVKGPANYDPFIARSPERLATTLDRAEHRVAYVLGRMQLTGRLSDADYNAAMVELKARFAAERAGEAPGFFNRGQFRYDTNVVLDEVEARLSEAPFPQLFEELGINNPSTAGIQIVTTIDAGAQREATYALWHHLAEVGPVLEAATADTLRLPADTLLATELPEAPEVHTFFVAAVQPGATVSQIPLQVATHRCTVDTEGVDRMAAVLARARKGESWRKADKAARTAIVEAMTPGTIVYASLRAPGICDLEIRPALQGATVVLEKGRLRAMVGGNDNRNFNRAVTAKRQLGSTWKPLIYAAAMHLNWTPTDRLDNREGAFPFEGVWYYPRAAHTAPGVVSLAWAGTHSENLSSVWLLYHLTDRLDREQFEQVARQVGMTRAPEESAEDYRVRMRDAFGVISTSGRFPELAYTAARAEIAAELEAEDPRLALEVRSLLYGGDAERERQQVARRYSGREATRRLAAIDSSFLHLQPVVGRCAEQAAALIAHRQYAGETLEGLRETTARPPRFRLFGGRGDRGEDGEEPEPAGEETETEDETAVLSALPSPVAGGPSLDALSDLRVQAGTTEEGAATLALLCSSGPTPEGWRRPDAADLDALARAAVALTTPSAEALRVDDRLTVGVLQQLERAARRRELVMASADPYSPETLRYHPDYRLLVGIRYVSVLARRLGVQTELPPVMSIPLGAADISLEEAALLYQGILTGNTFSFPGEKSLPGVGDYRTTSPIEAQARSTQLIAQIRDREGNVLYRAAPATTEVADPIAGVLTGGILSNVVRWGTGRRALGAVHVGTVAVPLLGKTGTTNGYRNAAFVGYIPAWRAEEGWSWADGHTVAVYVGYDDNQPMSRGSTRIAGSSGALPAWIGAVQGLADAGMLGQPPEATPWEPGEAYVWVPVAEGTGLPLPAGEAGTGRSVLQWGRAAPWTGELQVERRFWPVSLDVGTLPPGPPVPVAEAEGLESEEIPDDIWIPEMEGSDPG